MIENIFVHGIRRAVEFYYSTTQYKKLDPQTNYQVYKYFNDTGQNCDDVIVVVVT